MIEKFEKGKYYRYTGKYRPRGWNYEGGMDAVLDNQYHLCTKSVENKPHWANFDVACRRNSIWAWGDGFENWEEWVPQRGETVLTNTDQELIYLTTIEGALIPHVCVASSEKENFHKGLLVSTVTYHKIRPLPTKHTIKIDGKEISLSRESYLELKKSLIGE